MNQKNVRIKIEERDNNKHFYDQQQQSKCEIIAVCAKRSDSATWHKRKHNVPSKLDQSYLSSSYSSRLTDFAFN